MGIYTRRLFSHDDFKDCFTPEIIVRNAMKALNITSPIEEMSDHEISLVLRWCACTPRDLPMDEDVMTFGPGILHLMMFLGAIVFPSFYSRTILWEKS